MGAPEFGAAGGGLADGGVGDEDGVLGRGDGGAGRGVRARTSFVTAGWAGVVDDLDDGGFFVAVGAAWFLGPAADDLGLWWGWWR